MTIKFNQRVKHGNLDLLPGPALAFEDDRALSLIAHFKVK